MFCYFQSFFGTADHTQWGRYSAYDPRATAKFWRPDSESARDMWFCSYLQYHLHCQLSAASAYARERHVVLKGDLPIGAYVWGGGGLARQCSPKRGWAVAREGVAVVRGMSCRAVVVMGCPT